MLDAVKQAPDFTAKPTFLTRQPQLATHTQQLATFLPHLIYVDTHTCEWIFAYMCGFFLEPFGIQSQES